MDAQRSGAGPSHLRVLAAGDHFVAPDLFDDALRAELPGADLDVAHLTAGWPTDPFGPVGSGHSVVDEASGTEDDLIAALDGARVCLTQMAPFTEKVFDARPELEMLAVSRGGPVNVDLSAADRAGVAVAQAPGRNAAAAAEFAVGMMLAALRRIPVADAELRAGRWRGDFYAYDEAGLELEGATVGLVGYGAIGRIVARVLAAFRAAVLVADPYTDRATAQADGVRLVELDELLRCSGVVSLHARLTAETRGIIGAAEIDKLPHGAVVINRPRRAAGLRRAARRPAQRSARRARARRVRRRTPAGGLAVARRAERRRHPAPRRRDPADRAPRRPDRGRRGRPVPARRGPGAPGQRGGVLVGGEDVLMIIGVDVGTSMTKADAYDDHGGKLASAERASRLEQFADGRVEQDLEDVLGSVADVIRRVAAHRGEPVRALALTGQGDGLWLRDADGHATRPPISWLDDRAADVVRGWQDDGTVAEVYRRTGSGLFPGCHAPLLVALGRDEPESLDRAAVAGYCVDALVQRLTGGITVDASDASLPFLDVVSRTYDDAALAACGLSGRRGLLATPASARTPRSG